MGFKPINPEKRPVENYKMQRNPSKQTRTKIRWFKKWWVMILVAIVGLASVYGGVISIAQHRINTLTTKLQHDNAQKPAHFAAMSAIDANQSLFSYGANNHGVPNVKQLKRGIWHYLKNYTHELI